MSTRARLIGIVIVAVSASLIALDLATGVIVNWNWFSSLGYLSVYQTIILTKVGVFIGTFFLSAVVIWANGEFAHKRSGRRSKFRAAASPWSSVQGISQPPLLEHLYREAPWRLLIALLAVIPAALIAASEVGNWNPLLKFMYQVSYGKGDPLFGNDFGFYLFSLPALIALKNWILACLTFGALAAAVVYWIHGEIVLDGQRRAITPTVISHGSLLLGIFLVEQAFAFWLERYQLLFGDNGVVVGAGYTNIHVDLPILWGLVILSLLGAIACCLNVRARGFKLALVSLVLVFGTSLIIYPLFSALFERLYVKPNELNYEAPFIARNIALTREAYKLDNVLVKPFPADENLTYKSLQNDRPTIENIRLWDAQPLLDTYAQLQEIRTYYKFYDADIDRYRLSGKYQQVMLSAREIAPSLCRKMRRPGSTCTCFLRMVTVW